LRIHCVSGVIAGAAWADWLAQGTAGNVAGMRLLVRTLPGLGQAGIPSEPIAAARRLDTKSERKRLMTSFARGARAILAVSALVLGAAAAFADQFDAKKFFDKLQAEGNSMSKDFDAKKFFDKLQAEGNSAEKKIDAKAFFDRLAAEGNSMSKDFDAKKFFDKLQAEGNKSLIPPMVAMPK